MMKFALKATWQHADGTLIGISAADFNLIQAVLDAGSMKGAAQRMGVSYRTLWSQVQELNLKYGKELISTSQRSGAYLTLEGVNLRWMMELAKARLGTDLLRLNDQLNSEWMDVPTGLPWLNMALSDDPLLQELFNTHNLQNQLNLSMTWQGSIAALSSFHRQESRVAGCHLPVGEGRNSEVHQMMRRWLRGDNLLVLELFDRELGWISRPDFSATLNDVREKKARLINRNPASSTHHQLNALITRACLNPQDLNGYEDQEVSHLAVACRIAAGLADLGLGISQAATRYGLDFRPVSRDRYFLVYRQSDEQLPAIQILQNFIASDQFAAGLAGSSGYQLGGRRSHHLEEFLINLP